MAAEFFDRFSSLAQTHSERTSTGTGTSPTSLRVSEEGGAHRGCFYDDLCIERGPNIVLGIETAPTVGRTSPKRWVASQPTFLGWFCHCMAPVRCPKPSISGPRSKRKPSNKHPPYVAAPLFRNLASRPVRHHNTSIKRRLRPAPGYRYRCVVCCPDPSDLVGTRTAAAGPWPDGLEGPAGAN